MGSSETDLETGIKDGVMPAIPPLRARIDLSGRVAIVTGAGRGIGFGIARGLANSGATVVIADLSLEAAQQAAAALAGAGHAVFATQVDVSDEAGVDEMVASVIRDHGGIDILINNAGISSDEITEQTPVDAWRRVIDVDLTAPFICSKAVLPHMTAKRYGRIVNIGTVDARRLALVHSASYTAAKAGLEAFTRHLAYEVAGRGVTVNVVAPGATLTPRVAASLTTPEAYQSRAKRVPAGRLSVPEDVMRAVLFLVSDLADMVCGQVVDVDGGTLLGWTDTESYFKRRGVSFA